MKPILYDPSRHEPLRTISWDEELVRQTIERIGHVIRIRVKQCHETLKPLLRKLLSDLNRQANCQIQWFGNSRQIDNIVAIAL